MAPLTLQKPFVSSPSPGKTALLNLLVYYAAKMDVDVVLHDAPYRIFVLYRNGTVKFFPKNKIEEVTLLDERETMYLFNPDEERTQACLSDAFTVIATSPDQKHYSNFIKLPNMKVVFLSPWTLKEAHAALQALQPTSELSTKQLATLRKRFDEVGGSLRYLTYSRSKYAEIKAELTNLYTIHSVTRSSDLGENCSRETQCRQT